jgi:UDP-glucose 4-epimerase
MRILVTGGAGYIGSHAIDALGKQGHEILTYDNLSTGNQSAVLYGDLVKGDLQDGALLRRTLKDFSPAAIMHFAASIVVSESVENPLLYYRNNVVNAVNLMKAAARQKVPYFIYSSTAAVYGVPDQSPVAETAPLSPINPYGWSKMMAERIVFDVSARAGIKHVALRYFNVAGADPEGRIGQSGRNSTHLIRRALRAAMGELKKLPVYGADYNTQDGTCVRDYVHVSDLASAHLCALDYLAGPPVPGIRQHVMNCGYGRGFSVWDVVAMVKKVTGADFEIEVKPRRPGDAPSVVSDSSKLRALTGWQPKYDDLEMMVRTAWEWEKKRRAASVPLAVVETVPEIISQVPEIGKSVALAMGGD